MSSLYINSTNVNISEIARLTFFEVVGTESSLVVEVAMQLEHLKNLHNVIGQTIIQHAENLKKAEEANKKMN